ncbi:hypothetical protein CDL15_Pgr024466 [Punica granatum]|uniref:Alpha/beta hydrolase fold-3 domain-containing protein n=2 Tax=Punica granatum TaxID=22663 RepID=A0A218XY62_PUNGR|nr:hypothetical protein CDL15_Pgr024466 [Punica granatum]PKI32526.1 hypothetical protein CRG98_047070 [Punica granatum]
MPSILVKLYSIFFKYSLKHKLQTLSLAPAGDDSFGVTSRLDEPVALANPSFTDGIATKDIHIDPFSALSLRLFLPDTVLLASSPADAHPISDRTSYGGYSPPTGKHQRRLPLVIQFHGGAFVGGSNDTVANDTFCKRIAKLCDVIVVAVGYRLAPEHRYPAAFEDGLKALNWLVKQANLVECKNSIGSVRTVGGGDVKRSGGQKRIFDSLGVSTVEPWLAAHWDPSRCVLLGVSCGANIADYVSQKAVEAGRFHEPVKVVAQVLMYPFFFGSVPTNSEVKLANSYLYDKSICKMVWKLFLPLEELNLDHPAANPLVPRKVALKCMPPTLTVVAENDIMRDRAIAYSEALRRVNVDAPLLDYKDAVHEFATLDLLLQTPQAKACAEDIAIWVKKYISLRGNELSY